MRLVPRGEFGSTAVCRAMAWVWGELHKIGPIGPIDTPGPCTPPRDNKKTASPPALRHRRTLLLLKKRISVTFAGGTMGCVVRFFFCLLSFWDPGGENEYLLWPVLSPRKSTKKTLWEKIKVRSTSAEFCQKEIGKWIPAKPWAADTNFKLNSILSVITCACVLWGKLMRAQTQTFTLAVEQFAYWHIGCTSVIRLNSQPGNWSLIPR